MFESVEQFAGEHAGHDHPPDRGIGPGLHPDLPRHVLAPRPAAGFAGSRGAAGAAVPVSCRRHAPAAKAPQGPQPAFPQARGGLRGPPAVRAVPAVAARPVVAAAPRVVRVRELPRLRARQGAEVAPRDHRHAARGLLPGPRRGLDPRDPQRLLPELRGRLGRDRQGRDDEAGGHRAPRDAREPRGRARRPRRGPVDHHRDLPQLQLGVGAPRALPRDGPPDPRDVQAAERAAGATA